MEPETYSYIFQQMNGSLCLSDTDSVNGETISSYPIKTNGGQSIVSCNFAFKQVLKCMSLRSAFILLKVHVLTNIPYDLNLILMDYI